MNAGIMTEAAQFLFREYFFRILGIVSLQCVINYTYRDFFVKITFSALQYYFKWPPLHSHRFL
jgi:hypothetical protein